MKRAFQHILLSALLLAGSVGAAFGQGLPSQTYCQQATSGLNQWAPCSTSNPLKVSATITPSGTQDVNVTQILGAAVSATNPLFVSPATASTPWAVTGSGTAGTAAAGVVTVQGIGSMTPILATLSGTNNIATVTTLTTLSQFAGQAINLGNGTVGTGTLRVTVASDSTGVIGTTPAAAATGGAAYVHIAAGQATTVIKASAGTLYALCFNSAATATNTTTLYDNPSTSGTVIAIPNTVAATVPNCLSFGPTGLAFTLGLTIITAAANSGDMTVAYK